jgi:acyl-CoA synthetase (NDP forming)
MERFGKPVFGVRLSAGENERTLHRVKGRKYKGVFYPTPEQAVKAFSKMVTYRRFRERVGIQNRLS